MLLPLGEKKPVMDIHRKRMSLIKSSRRQLLRTWNSSPRSISPRAPLQTSRHLKSENAWKEQTGATIYGEPCARIGFEVKWIRVIDDFGQFRGGLQPSPSNLMRASPTMFGIMKPCPKLCVRRLERAYVGCPGSVTSGVESGLHGTCQGCPGVVARRNHQGMVV